MKKLLNLSLVLVLLLSTGMSVQAGHTTTVGEVSPQYEEYINPTKDNPVEPIPKGKLNCKNVALYDAIGCFVDFNLPLTTMPMPNVASEKDATCILPTLDFNKKKLTIPRVAIKGFPDYMWVLKNTDDISKRFIRDSAYTLKWDSERADNCPKVTFNDDPLILHIPQVEANGRILELTLKREANMDANYDTVFHLIAAKLVK